MFSYLAVLESMFRNTIYVEKQEGILSSIGAYCSARNLSINAEISGWREDEDYFAQHLNGIVQHSNTFSRHHFKNIHMIHGEYIELVKNTKTISDTFSKTLRNCMLQRMVLSGFGSFKALLVEAGLENEHRLICGWYSKGKTPAHSSKNIKIIKQLERFMEMKPKTLQNFILKKETDSSFRRIGSAYSDKMSLILKASHAYPGGKPFTHKQGKFPIFHGEWEDYVNFKSLPVYHQEGAIRNQKQMWKTVRPDQNEGLRNNWQCYNSDGLVSATADRSFRSVNMFMSFLSMPSEAPAFDEEFLENISNDERRWAEEAYTGLGMNRNSLSMAHLVDVKLMGKFISWNMKRQGSSNGVVDALEIFKTLTNTRDGYIFQQRGMAKLIGVEEDQWEESCKKVTRFLTETIGALENAQQTKQSRDPKEPIREYIESKSPIDVLVNIEKIIISQKPDKNQEGNYAIWTRDLLLARFIRFNPLRAGTLAQLTIFKHSMGDNRGMVFKKDGKWRLSIPAIAFKNMSGSRDRNYEVSLHHSVGEALEEYLSVRHALKGSHKCPYLFRTKKRAVIKDDTEDKALAGSDLGRVYRLITQKLLKGTPGFGPHAARHIIATDWLKKQPRDYLTVANILHDKLETVISEYAHIDANDGLERYYNYLETIGNGERVQT